MSVFQTGKYSLPLGEKTYVMGIVNVTPDSFSDGGKWYTPEKAAKHALLLQEQGADLLDLGGQSTRPGYTPIGWKEEWERLEPVFALLKGKVRVPVSVDTFYPEVAELALEAGADIINDVTGFAREEMFSLARQFGCGCVIMHDQPDFSTIRPFFDRQLEKAVQFGLSPEQVCFDPGVGFGKTYEENLRILGGLKALLIPGTAMLVGASRKRVIGQPCGNPPFMERLPGTIAAHTLAIAGGADIIRVHDVAEAVQAVRVTDAVLQEKRTWESQNSQ